MARCFSMRVAPSPCCASSIVCCMRKTCLDICKHDRFTPTREIRRHVRFRGARSPHNAGELGVQGHQVSLLRLQHCLSGGTGLFMHLQKGPRHANERISTTRKHKYASSGSNKYVNFGTNPSTLERKRGIRERWRRVASG